MTEEEWEEEQYWKARDEERMLEEAAYAEYIEQCIQEEIQREMEKEQ
jgi:hypothetical protein